VYIEVSGYVKKLCAAIFHRKDERTFKAVTEFAIEYKFPNFVQGEADEEIVTVLEHTNDKVKQARILEAMCQWVVEHTRKVDVLLATIGMALSQHGHERDWTDVWSRLCENLEQVVRTEEEEKGSQQQQQQQEKQQENGPASSGWSRPAKQVILERLGTCILHQIDSEASAPLSAVLERIAKQESARSLLAMIQNPTLILARIVQTFEQLQATMARLVAVAYQKHAELSKNNANAIVWRYFQYYSVGFSGGVLRWASSTSNPVELTGTMDLHVTPEEGPYQNSQFKVVLVDTCGQLMKFLLHLEQKVSEDPHFTIAIDLEGVKLCRHGELSLMQISCSDDLQQVYVIDVHCLEDRAFHFATPNKTTLKKVLESAEITKAWFDPRNDVDALYHQYVVHPQGVVDLQLAEVAIRRSGGQNVEYVPGLCKLLMTHLGGHQKEFCSQINELGKRIFEPTWGGFYEAFSMRPLNPILVIYAAHDSRYMLDLLTRARQSLSEDWLDRVKEATRQRCEWFYYKEYNPPRKEAPVF